MACIAEETRTVHNFWWRSVYESKVSVKFSFGITDTETKNVHVKDSFSIWYIWDTFTDEPRHFLISYLMFKAVILIMDYSFPMVLVNRVVHVKPWLLGVSDS
jgi:hypothetical protein